MSLKKKIFLTFILILLLIASAIGGYAYFMFSSMTRSSLEPKDLGVNNGLDSKIVNIALFGIDGRDDEQVEGDRTDSILIGSLDLKDNSVKVTSIMRDTFAKICYPGDSNSATGTSSEQNKNGETDKNDSDNSEQNGESSTLIDDDGNEIVIDYENRDNVAEYTKINAAYNEDGVEASIMTLNQNFDLNIEDYITVDFNCLMDIVDAVGGVELNIPNEDVLYWTNEYLKESNGWGHRNDPDIENTGVQTLTGAQALAFARNRYSDSDFGRSQRQREVVQAIFNKVKDQDVLTIINLISKLYPYVKTSLSLNEITSYASSVLNAENLEFQGFQVPTGKHGTAGFIDGEWFLFPDTLVDNCIALHKFIYGDSDDYTPSARVKQISAVIDYDMNEYAYDKSERIGEGEDLDPATVTEDEIFGEDSEAEEPQETEELQETVEENSE